MKFRDLVRTAVGNLTRHKVRTALTTVGVIVGILTIVTMVSLGIGVRREMLSAFNTLGPESLIISPITENATGFNPFGQAARTVKITPVLIDELRARDDIVALTPYLRLPEGMRLSVRLDGQEVRANPREPSADSIPEPFETGPAVLAGAATPPEDGGMVVTEAILEPLGYGPADYPGLIGRQAEVVLYAPRGESKAFPLTIAGITERRWGSLAMGVPDKLKLLEWWYDDPAYLQNWGYDELRIRAKSLNDAVQILDWLGGRGYRVESLKQLLDTVNRGMIVLQTMLASVGVLALLVASIGIANTMIMAVYERTKEIGILKAVGAAPGQIRVLFVAEAALIGLLGGIAGTILGWLLGKLLNWLILVILRWQEMDVRGTFFVVSPWLVAGALVFATLVGLLAGLYPAARAARLAPLDALRYE